MSGTEFVALPPAKGNWDAESRKRIAEFAADLRANPDEWAVYPIRQSYVGARAAASRINRGLVKAFGAGFDAVTREQVLYVRYTGE